MRAGAAGPYVPVMTDVSDTANTAANATAPTSTAWLRVFALVYDPFLWLGELLGMRHRRRNLLAEARGRVVEIGCGTGLNIAHYPDAVDELLLTEPEPGMRRKLVRRVTRLRLDAHIVDAAAEHLPFDDASVDTVVSTLVLCTAADPAQVLDEIARVLRPGGRLLFIEHVRAGSRLLAAVQDRMVRPWRGFAGGCVCNRRTAELMCERGFTVELTADVWHGMPALVHPLVVGSATAG